MINIFNRIIANQPVSPEELADLCKELELPNQTLLKSILSFNTINTLCDSSLKLPEISEDRIQVWRVLILNWQNYDSLGLISYCSGGWSNLCELLLMVKDYKTIVKAISSGILVDFNFIKQIDEIGLLTEEIISSMQFMGLSALLYATTKISINDELFEQKIVSLVSKNVVQGYVRDSCSYLLDIEHFQYLSPKQSHSLFVNWDNLSRYKVGMLVQSPTLPDKDTLEILRSRSKCSGKVSIGKIFTFPKKQTPLQLCKLLIQLDLRIENPKNMIIGLPTVSEFTAAALPLQLKGDSIFNSALTSLESLNEKIRSNLNYKQQLMQACRLIHSNVREFWAKSLNDVKSGRLRSDIVLHAFDILEGFMSVSEKDSKDGIVFLKQYFSELIDQLTEAEAAKELAEAA